ncbi:MAG: hypothetical protein KC561_05195 [Myxococcales bacterium]|nr:hypothetical protein [Myxococcales bacterium]
MLQARTAFLLNRLWKRTDLMHGMIAPNCARTGRPKPRLSLLVLAVALFWTAPAWALMFPLSTVDGHWMPTDADGVQITALRAELVPSASETHELIWLLDATMVVRNNSGESVQLNLAIPNEWSRNEGRFDPTPADFWGEIFVNGTLLESEVVAISPNPAFQNVSYRSVRTAPMTLGSDRAAHVRVRYALPAVQGEHGEMGVDLPFHLRALWDGAIDFGNITLEWTDQMYAFRSNLSAYSLYTNRAEWFLINFEPDTDMQVRFLPRPAIFNMVIETFECPTPQELFDRVSAGDMELIRDMLSAYSVDRLDVCSDVPQALAGSESAARNSGLLELDLEQFAGEESGLTGPLVRVREDYRSSDLTDLEAVYVRFLEQELAARRQQ